MKNPNALIPPPPETVKTETATSPQKTKISLLIGMVALILILLASTGYLAYQNYQLRKEISQLQASPSPTSTPDPTANWKTYTYQIFTIKFPLDWSTTDSKNPVQFLNYTPDPKSGGEFNPSTDKGKLKVEIYQKSTSDSLESYLAQQKASAIEARGSEINWQETKTVVAGKEAIRVKTAIPGFTYNFKDVSSNTIFSIAFELDFDNYKELSDQILSTFKFLDAESTTGTVCKSINLSLSLTLPNQNWKCKVDNLGKEQKGWDGTVSASSQAITIVITSLGRGPYCNTGQDASCQTVNFFSNGTINLDLYKTGGQNKEIFGMIVNDASISIKWTGMETRDLTSAEKQEVINILTSISRQ